MGLRQSTEFEFNIMFMYTFFFACIGSMTENSVRDWNGVAVTKLIQ